jgi:hypothetical protein
LLLHKQYGCMSVSPKPCCVGLIISDRLWNEPQFRVACGVCTPSIPN